MSSQLHQAVELAQAGQREQARHLLLQFLQNEPNHEVAWLWLASVASDQTEYLRALNEVLRINPTNQRAQQLIAEFQQQQQQPPPSSGEIQVGTPAQFERPGSPPASFTSTPPPPPVASGPAPYYQQQPGAYMQPVQAPPPSQQVRVEREIVTKRRRGGCLGCGPGCLGCGGCGCGQGCLLAFLVLFVVPILACGGLSYSNIGMGPLDLLARHFPGDFGRKEMDIPTNNYAITVEVPRSWFLVNEDENTMWPVTAEMLDILVPFENESTNWVDITNAGQVALILDADMYALTRGGMQTRMVLESVSVEGNYTCATIETSHTAEDVYDYGNDLCGYRVDDISAGPATSIFKNIDPPNEIHRIDFYTPVNTNQAFHWQIELPDELYTVWEEDIGVVIESVQINAR